jgi:thioredoxin-dependent peroxiredoxin
LVIVCRLSITNYQSPITNRSSLEGNEQIMPQERPNAFDFWGPKTLVGPELKPGDTAPAFQLSKGKEAISSAQFAGKPLVISVIPSIDTRVCSIQTRRFNESAAALGDAANILTVSADLPFAQARWCGAEGIDRLIMGSDYLDMNFGDASAPTSRRFAWRAARSSSWTRTASSATPSMCRSPAASPTTMRRWPR